MNSQCWLCHLNRHVGTARALAGEEAATAVAKGLMQAYLSAPEGAASPYFGPIVTELLEKHCGLSGDRYAEEKEMSNRFVLERLDAIQKFAEETEDPVYASLQLAILGNYIDFSALQGEVSFEKLDEMLAQAGKMELDSAAYEKFLQDLSSGKTLLYLTDNAGEIGFDRVCAQQIQKRFPHLEITFCVRGGNAANDATRLDAAEMGVEFPIIDNGSCIAGTIPELLGDEAKKAMEKADVILSKGQANVETLYGTGYNIYYAFLIKCALFINLFDKPKLTPMLVREKDIKK